MQVFCVKGHVRSYVQMQREGQPRLPMTFISSSSQRVGMFAIIHVGYQDILTLDLRMVILRSNRR